MLREEEGDLFFEHKISSVHQEAVSKNRFDNRSNNCCFGSYQQKAVTLQKTQSRAAAAYQGPAQMFGVALFECGMNAAAPGQL